MKFWNRWKKENWFPYTVAAVVGVLTFALIQHLGFFANGVYEIWLIVKPLLYGLILAYLMDPVARFYQNKPLRKMKKQTIARNLSVILAVITILIVVGGLGAAVLPTLIKSVSNLVNSASAAITALDQNSGHLSVNLPFGIGKALSEISISSTIINSVSDFLKDNFDNIADTSATVGTGFANFVIAFVLAIYYMMDKERLQQMAHRIMIFVLKEKKFEHFHSIYRRADVILLSYIKCNLLEALIVGACNALFMLIGGLPYVLLISLTVAITNLAPTFGPIVGALIGAVMLVLVNPWYALAFLIFTVVVQTVDGYIIKPRLFGETLGVAPLLILIMIILGGRVMGVVGILLAIPVAAIAQFIADDIWSNRKAKNDKKNLDMES